MGEVAVGDIGACAGAELAAELRLEEHLPNRLRSVVVADAGRRRCVVVVVRRSRFLPLVVAVGVRRGGVAVVVVVVVPESVVLFGCPNGLVAGRGPVLAGPGDYLNGVAVSCVIHCRRLEIGEP